LCPFFSPIFSPYDGIKHQKQKGEYILTFSHNSDFQKFFWGGKALNQAFSGSNLSEDFLARENENDPISTFYEDSGEI